MGRFGYDYAYDTHGLTHGVISALCGFSIYFNGTSNVNEDFVYRAPVHLELDSVSNETVSVDWFATGFDITLDANVIFAEQAVNSRYCRHESSLSGTAIVSISFLSTSAEARFFARDSNGINYGYSVDLSSSSADKFRFVYDSGTGDISVYVDDVLEDSSTFTPTGTMTMDMHYIGNEDIGSNFSTMLLTSYEATGLGKANFVTNQDDGLSVISDNGTAWLITEDVAGSSQIKPDGTSSTAYVWPDVALFHMPNTGPIVIDGSGRRLEYTHDSLIDYSTFSWSMFFKNDKDSASVFGGKYCNHKDTSGLSVMSIRDRAAGAGNYCQMQFTDGSGVTFYNKIPLVALDGLHEVEVRFNHTTMLMSVYIDGVHISAVDQVVTITSGFKFNNFVWGAENNGSSPIIADFYEFGFVNVVGPDEIGMCNAVTRLPSIADLNYYNVVSNVGVPFEITPNDIEAKSPYYTDVANPVINLGVLSDSRSTGGGDTIDDIMTYYTALGVSNLTYTNTSIVNKTVYDFAPTGWFEAQDPGDVPNGYSANTSANITYQISQNITHVWIFLLVNSRIQGFTVDETYLALTAIIDDARANGIPIVLSKVIPPKAALTTEITWTVDMNSRLELIEADDLKLVQCDGSMAVRGSNPFVIDDTLTVTGDGVHPLSPTGTGKVAFGDTDENPNTYSGFVQAFESLVDIRPKLISETPCTATSGEQQLQLIDGIAQVIDGKFQFILIP